MSTVKVGTIQSLAPNVPPLLVDSLGTEVSQGCTAWVKFTAAGVILSSFNIISVTTVVSSTRGSYNIDHNLVGNYAVTGTAQTVPNTPLNVGAYVGVDNRTSVDVYAVTYPTAPTAADYATTIISVAFFGGL